MAVFQPCVAMTRAKINDTNIVDGQLIVVVETGELYFDYNGQRIPLIQKDDASGDSSDSSSSDSGTDEPDNGLTYRPAAVTPGYDTYTLRFSIFPNSSSSE